MLEVIRTNVGNDPNGRVGNLAQPPSLSLLIHTHFNNSYLMSTREVKQGLGNSNAIIEISLGCERFPPLNQNVAHHVLRRGLAIAACHRYNWNLEFSTMVCGQILICPQGISNFQDYWLTSTIKPGDPTDSR
jgi:hypothetical protein